MLYDKNRNKRSLGEYYHMHLDAMTNEELHNKSDIAAELAARDQRIDELTSCVSQSPKVKITYCSVNGDHPMAVPEPTSSEVVEVDDATKLRKYIEAQRDEYGYTFKKEKKRFFGFDYTSHAGGVKVEEYRPPKIKKL